MWDAKQKKTFAKEMWDIDFRRGLNLRYLTGGMRSAIVAERCFAIVRTQLIEAVTVEAMDNLLRGVRDELCRLTKNPDFFE